MNWNDIFEYRDGELFWKKKTAINVLMGKRAGWKTHGYRRCSINNKSFYIHRIIWEMFNGRILKRLVIDHIDGNKSNNKIENLRAVTHTVNIRNQKKRTNNTSGTPGVSWSKGKNMWVAYITIDKKRKKLGCFKKKEDAITKRLEVEKRYKFKP